MNPAAWAWDNALGDLDRDLQRVGLGIGAVLGDVVVDRPSVDKFHDEVMEVPGLADVVGPNDVGVVQLRGGLAFIVETLDEVRVVAVFLGQDFDRDDPVQGQLPGLVDRRHRPGAEFREDLVAGDLPARLLLVQLGLDAADLALGDDPLGDEDPRQAVLARVRPARAVPDDFQAPVDVFPGRQAFFDHDPPDYGIRIG